MQVSVLLVLEVVITSLVVKQDSTTPLDFIITSLVIVQEDATPLEIVITSLVIMQEDATPENPIRRFVISPQIFNLIKSALLDPDMVELPTDYTQGLDFRVVKTTKGGYSDYSTSNWARRESALTSTETAAIEQYGLFNLADFLPKRPDETALKVMKEMFEASVDGQPYDAEKWGSYYRPAGVQIANAQPRESAPATQPAPAPAPTVEATPEPVAVEVPTEATAPVEDAKPSSQRAEDILAMIRNRQK